MIPLPRPIPPNTEPPPVVDMVLLRHALGFVSRSLRRHKLRAIGAFGLIGGATLLSLWALPRSYHVEAKLLAQPNLVMPALGNPGRAIPGDADAPTRAASETVLRRENLVGLIRATNLVKEWDDRRAPAVRVKDALVRAFKGPPSQEDRVDALVGLLEKRLRVTTSDRTVNIEIDWPDSSLAYRLVDVAQQNFLEARHAGEVASIQEAIDILESHASRVRGNVDDAYDEVRSLQRGEHVAALPAPQPPRPRRSAPAATSAAPQPSRELEQLKSQLTAKQRALSDLEEFRHRRLSELQTQLNEQRATYGPQHPVILALEQSIDQLQQESPQVQQLRLDTRRLDAEIAELTPRESTERAAPTREREREREPAPAAEPRVERTSVTALDLAEERLRVAQAKYDELQARLEAARIELDTARAAFKYRYSIVTPAQLPKKPDRPNVPLTLFVGFSAATLLALAAALSADLAGGRVVEAWQIERTLHLPVLAEVARP